MRIVFMGTPSFAVEILDNLYQAGYEIAAVVTQPDKPKGRGKKMEAPAVKVRAEDLGLEVYQPLKLRDEEFISLLRKINPEAIIVAAYGKILPKEILDLPPLGCINVHGSLLPKYRGAAPIQRAIMDGDEVTGVTIMRMNEGMDTGEMLTKVEVKIESDDNSGSLFAKMAKAGAKLLLQTLPLWQRGEITPQKQDENLATYAPMIAKEEELIDWHKSAREIGNLLRGLAPAPCGYTYFRGERLKIGACTWLAEENSAAAGEVLAVEKNGITVACGKGCLRLIQVQPAGKKMISAWDFSNGSKIKLGEILGEENGK